MSPRRCPTDGSTGGTPPPDPVARRATSPAYSGVLTTASTVSRWAAARRSNGSGAIVSDRRYPRSTSAYRLLAARAGSANRSRSIPEQPAAQRPGDRGLADSAGSGDHEQRERGNLLLGTAARAAQHRAVVAFERGVRAAVHAEGFFGRLGGRRHRVSGPVEGFGVGERAAQPGLVAGQDSDLEVRLPLRPRRRDLVDGAGPESEPAVVGGIAEQRDQRFAERVGGTEDGVHQGAAHPAPLAVRPDGQRPEREDGGLTDMPPGAPFAAVLVAQRVGDQQ